MSHKITQFFLGSLVALFALLFTHSTQANSLVNDPFIRQHIDKSTFEPGGQNHLFGSARGAVADRKGDIYIIPTASIKAGGVNIDQALIAGYYEYNARFGGHEHDEHAPFANSSSRQKTAQEGIQGVDFTSLSMQWKGIELHPADAYDGEQGSGYPAPTGARDEYSYAVSGNAIGARISFNDNRTTQDRLNDRKNSLDNAKATITDAFEQGLTHNPDLNRMGNMVEAGSALAKGLGAVAGIPFEWAGASDVADGASTAKDLAVLGAMYGLSHENKLEAMNGLQTAQNLQSQYGQWKAENPNKAVAIDTAIDTAQAWLKKGGDRVDAKGDKTIGSRGGNATDIGHTNASGQTIYQRDSGGYYSINPTTGKQQTENSPYEHGNTLNDQPAESYCLTCRTTGEVVKYGETTHGEDRYGVGNQKRYTQNDLDGMNAEYRKLNSGTKKDMHQDQTQNIREYQEKNGTRPKYNKSDY